MRSSSFSFSRQTSSEHCDTPMTNRFFSFVEQELKRNVNVVVNNNKYMA